ncbi:hypothetical protein PG993_013580 [Apiospora rasikravindrae]|uniref:Uncharacterized protein n=1 Tax=Apiospora rasikravindrae TaxID=990691 RepID=A0ABR1RY70_9PEZI
MDGGTPGPEVYRVIDYARAKLEDEFEKLNMREALFHGHATKTYTPIKEERRAKMWANMDVKRLSLEEAVAKALDLVFEYWKKTNRGLISETGKMPGKKDITQEAQMKVLRVKIMVLGELKRNPELFREDDKQVAAAPGGATDGKDAEETPSRRPRQIRGRQEHQQEMPDNRAEQAAPKTYFFRHLRPRPGNATRDRREHDAAQRLPDLQRQLQRAVQAQHRGSQTGAGPQEGRPRGRGREDHNQARPLTLYDHEQQSGVESPLDPGCITVRTDPSPASDAPRSGSFRPVTQYDRASQVQSAHSTTPTRRGPRRNPRRGANRTGLGEANTNTNATANANSRPRHRAAGRKGAAAKDRSTAPSPPPQQQRQHIETPHLLDKIDRQSEDLKQRLGKLEANIRSQERAIQEMERECNDARRIAADMRRALSALNEVAPRP